MKPIQTPLPQQQQRQQQRQETTLTLLARQRLAFLQQPIQVLTQDLRLKAEKNPFLIYEKNDNTTSIEDIHHRAQQAQHKTRDAATESLSESDQEDTDAIAEAVQKHERMITNYSAPKTLAEHLEEQILSQFEPSLQRDFILYLAGSVDERGYLTTPQEELIEAYRQMGGRGKTTVLTNALTEAVKALQSLDPVGVGARSLEECLALQVRADPTYSDARGLRLKLCNHLHRLTSDTLEQLAKRLQCSVSELQAARDYLRTLNPTPGYAFAPSQPLEVTEIIATQKNDGRWIATMNEALLPTFLTNEALIQATQHASLSVEEKKQLSNFEHEARLLTDAFHNRNLTLCLIAQAIFDRQQDFLSTAGNPITLKPLHQKEIAKTLHFNESTISRAIHGKYIRLPHRSKPLSLKAFFSKSALQHTSTKGTSTLSDQQVKGTLRQLIAKEDRTHPLSDQALANHFKKKGLRIARRTIAKYRDYLGIPSTRDRRQHDENP